MGVRWFQHSAGCWSHIHFPQLKMACLCYGCSHLRQIEQEHWYKYFWELFSFPCSQQKQRLEAVLGGNHSKWEVWKQAAYCLLLTQSLSQGHVLCCGVPRRCACWAAETSWMSAQSNLWLCWMQEAKAELVPKAANWRSKELPFRMSDLVLCKQIMACPHVTGYLKLQDALQRLFLEALVQFRSVLGKKIK